MKRRCKRVVDLRPIERRSLVDAGSLDGRGIAGVDVGHDDQTIIKQFVFLFCYLPSLQTTYLLSFYYAYEYAFKVKYFLYGLLSEIGFSMYKKLFKPT